MSIKKLSNHKTVIQRLLEGYDDDMGGKIRTWKDWISDISVRIQPLNGQEKAEFDKTVEDVSHKIYLDPSQLNEGIDSTNYRLKSCINDKYYNILSILNINNLDRLWTLGAKLGQKGVVMAAPHIGIVVATTSSPKEVRALADYTCNGVSDNVTIQDAIDDAQTYTNPPPVYITSGTYNFEGPVFCGYDFDNYAATDYYDRSLSNTPIGRKNPPSIIGIGDVSLVWAADHEDYMIAYSTSSVLKSCGIHNLYLDCVSTSRGIYLNRDAYGQDFSNLIIYRPNHVGIDIIDSWGSRFRNIMVHTPNGHAMRFNRANGVLVESLSVRGGTFSEAAPADGSVGDKGMYTKNGGGGITHNYQSPIIFYGTGSTVKHVLIESTDYDVSVPSSALMYILASDSFMLDTLYIEHATSVQAANLVYMLNGDNCTIHNIYNRVGVAPASALGESTVYLDNCTESEVINVRSGHMSSTGSVVTLDGCTNCDTDRLTDVYDEGTLVTTI